MPNLNRLDTLTNQLEKWESPDRSVLLRKVVTPVISAVAVEVLGALGLVYNGAKALVQALPAAMHLTLSKLPWQSARNFGARFPACFHWSAFTKSAGSALSSSIGLCVGGGSTLLFSNRAKKVRAYSEAIFGKAPVPYTRKSRLQNTWTQITHTINNHKYSFAAATTIILAMGALKFFNTTGQIEEVLQNEPSKSEQLCEIAQRIQQNPVSLADVSQKIKPSQLSLVIGESRSYLENLKTMQPGISDEALTRTKTALEQTQCTQNVDGFWKCLGISNETRGVIEQNKCLLVDEGRFTCDGPDFVNDLSWKDAKSHRFLDQESFTDVDQKIIDAYNAYRDDIPGAINTCRVTYTPTWYCQSGYEKYKDLLKSVLCKGNDISKCMGFDALTRRGLLRPLIQAYSTISGPKCDEHLDTLELGVFLQRAYRMQD